MKLRKVILRRYRGAKDEVIFNFSDCSVIVGRNDSGKSTVLKALDLFLNNTEALPDISNAFLDDPTCEIELHIEPKNQKIIIDESIATSLKDEELLNEDDILIIKKVYNTSKSKITPDTYIYRKIYENDDFVLKSERDLLSLCRKSGIDTKKAHGEEYNNVEKRKKLRSYYEKAKKAFVYEFDKLPSTGTSRGKLIYDELKRILPRFEYFHADSSLSESDAAIQKYFKTLSIDLLKSSGVDELEEKVRKGIGIVLDKITEKINDVLPEEQQVDPYITFNWTNLIQTIFRSKDNEADIPLSFRGDGFRRITMMAYFEYLAEGNKGEKQNIIFGFEEPETFLHPSAQEQLQEKLIGLKEAGYQVIITTHSPIIVSNSNRNDLIHIRKGDKTFIVDQEIANLLEIIEDLGITPNNQFFSEFEKAKLIVLVEGPDDVRAFYYLAQQYKENSKIEKTFEDRQFVFIPIGGCDSVIHWHTLNILNDLGKPFYIIQDSDRDEAGGDSKPEKTLLDLGFIQGKDFWILRKRSIENYINPKCLCRNIDGLCISYDDYTHMKTLCKTHLESAKLGGKKVCNT